MGTNLKAPSVEPAVPADLDKMLQKSIETQQLASGLIHQLELLRENNTVRLAKLNPAVQQTESTKIEETQKLLNHNIPLLKELEKSGKLYSQQVQTILQDLQKDLNKPSGEPVRAPTQRAGM